MQEKINVKLIPEELYSQIVRLIPIACVDLIVINPKSEVLLLKRKNEPAKNEWWFPGGRVHYMETRIAAAIRKLKEECGLVGESVQEIGTYDVILENGNSDPSHGITTVFHVAVKTDKVIADDQSTEYAWRPPHEWLSVIQATFVRMRLQELNYDRDKK